jgi:3-hydroxybutyryl-CoA dehydrogenase
MKIGVIGAGTMGNGIAHVCALANNEVVFIDLSEDQLKRGLATIEKNLDRQIKKEIISSEDKANTLRRISTQTEINDTISNCDLIIEVIIEKESIKNQLINDLNKFTSSKTIVASNTSSISITALASAYHTPENFIGVHFMNPVPVMPLVEIICGENTSKATTDFSIEFVKSLGKTPIAVNDYPGFIANRILMPMINEAIYSYYEGVAEVEAIDGIMELGMAHKMGPLKLADFIGLDVCLNILRVMYEGFGNPKYAPCPLLVNYVNAGKLGVKSGKGFYDYA